jgi:broad specificity phosphatase PhoE
MKDSSPELPATIYRITLLRHGESVGNAERYHQGQSEFALTERGLAQSRALADRWLGEDVRFDHIIASPLARARQTAESLAQALSMEVEYDPDWMERNSGLLTGLHETEAWERFPMPEFINPYEPIAESGEGEWELYLRAGRAVLNLLRRPPGRYLIVSHGGLLNKVLYVILGISPQANFQGASFQFQNTAFAVLEYDSRRHTWLMEKLNDREHWKES